MNVELLYWKGCPSYPEAHDLLAQVLAENGVNAEIAMREVHTDDDAQRLRFPGSPTIRIDGEDVDPVGAAAPPALTCRVYHLPDGRISPLPSRDQVAGAVRRLKAAA